MPEFHKLRLHIEYDLLYMADLRAILGSIEKAYNALQRPRRRTRPTDPLTVQTARTGNSITLIALGGVGLYYLGKLVATREGFWKSEKVKWEAKTARLDYEERLKQADAEVPRYVIEVREKRENDVLPQRQVLSPESRAVTHIEELMMLVDRSEHITSLKVEIDGEDTDPNSPDPLIKPDGPKNPLGPLIRHTGRKFR